MFKRVELWAVGLVCLAGGLAALAALAIVRTEATGDERFGWTGELALSLSYLPEETVRVLRLAISGDRPDLQTNEARFEGRSGFRFALPPGADPDAGFLLLSRYDGDRARSVVELIDLDAQRTVHTWTPDFGGANARSSLQSRFIDIDRDNAPARARAIHPIVTSQGELVFQNTSPLVKVGACGEIAWTIDRLFHHSNEEHPDGGYLVPTFIEPSTLTGVTRLFREDGIAHVSRDGQILSEKSVPRLLIENGLAHLIYGLDFYSDDPLHLNDIQPVTRDGPHFRRGDLFLSLRNVSAIVLYRPSTNKVLWLKQGPWVNQHDVDVLDDHRIAVFDNRRFSYADRSVVDGANDVVIYDFARDETTSPYAEALRRLDVRTPFEGRSEIMADGDVVVEETESARMIRLRLTGEVEWEYVNRASDGQLYLLNWSRELSSQRGAALARRLAALECGVGS